MTDEERQELWEKFAEILAAIMPGNQTWYHESRWEDNRTVFSAMLDLHERMLVIERKLSQQSGGENDRNP